MSEEIKIDRKTYLVNYIDFILDYFIKNYEIFFIEYKYILTRSCVLDLNNDDFSRLINIINKNVIYEQSEKNNDIEINSKLNFIYPIISLTYYYLCEYENLEKILNQILYINNLIPSNIKIKNITKEKLMISAKLLNGIDKKDITFLNSILNKYQPNFFKNIYDNKIILFSIFNDIDLNNYFSIRYSLNNDKVKNPNQIIINLVKNLDLPYSKIETSNELTKVNYILQTEYSIENIRKIIQNAISTILFLSKQNLFELNTEFLKDIIETFINVGYKRCFMLIKEYKGNNIEKHIDINDFTNLIKNPDCKKIYNLINIKTKDIDENMLIELLNNYKEQKFVLAMEKYIGML